MYLVSANGGIEDPSHRLFPSDKYDDALSLFRDWKSETISNPGERVQLFRISEDAALELLDEASYEYDPYF